MKNKLISLLGLVSKAKYEALLVSYDNWTQLCRDLSKQNKMLNWHVNESKSLLNSLNQAKSELSKARQHSKRVQEKNVEMSSELIVLTTKIEDLKRENEALEHSLFKTQEFSKHMRQDNAILKSESEELEEEINALNNLRASDRQTIKELSKRKKTVYYTCKGLEREFNNQRELAKHLKITQSQVNYMLNGKRQNKYNIKRHER